MRKTFTCYDDMILVRNSLAALQCFSKVYSSGIPRFTCLLQIGKQMFKKTAFYAAFAWKYILLQTRLWMFWMQWNMMICGVCVCFVNDHRRFFLLSRIVCEICKKYSGEVSISRSRMIRSSKVSKARDWCLEFSDRSEIWQASGQ